MARISHKNRQNRQFTSNSRKTAKYRRLFTKKTKIRQHQHQLQLQYGGYTTQPIAQPIAQPITMVIKYFSTSGDTSSYIQLVSPGVVDWTSYYNQKRLDKEPQLEISGLDANKKYLLTMTDPDALGKTWTHWVVVINGDGQIVRPAIVKYNGPSPQSGSRVHRYIFRLYVMAVEEQMPIPLDSMSRDDYFAVILKKIIDGKPVLSEATYTIDSSKIKNKNGKWHSAHKIVGLTLSVFNKVVK